MLLARAKILLAEQEMAGALRISEGGQRAT
jgi:hypothetical protein